MRVLSGAVYMTKSRGPRTEPWGTARRQVCREERLLLHLTRKQQECIVNKCYIELIQYYTAWLVG